MTVPIPFHTIDWSTADTTRHNGTSGYADWKTLTFGGLRVRMVEYSPGYLADHWCAKGHVLLCIDGELVSELSDGTSYVLKPGMSYQVSDGESSHRSRTECGAVLFIVDGDFLKTPKIPRGTVGLQ